MIVGGPNMRPEWCPHQSCKPIHLSANCICGGQLPEPLPHERDNNTMRLCLKQFDSDDATVFEINHSDILWIERVLYALKERES